MNALAITTVRVDASLWVDYLRLTGETSDDLAMATYGDQAYPYVWVYKADVVRRWP